MKRSDKEIFCKLREEHYTLLPRMEMLNRKFTLDIQYDLKKIMIDLKPYQRIEVISRTKECESAIRALQRREEGALFNQGKEYTITSLPDLIGVRVLYFPCELKDQIQELLNRRLNDWTSDPIKFSTGGEISKFHGKIEEDELTAELQIVPMLVGAFWDAEHSLYYKPHPEYKSIKTSLSMKEDYDRVMKALFDFEQNFEKHINKNVAQ